jgi:hypothetical protein
MHMKNEPEIDAIAHQVETSRFVKAMLKIAVKMDAVDAANDAQVVSEILSRRADRLIREDSSINKRLHGA